MHAYVLSVWLGSYAVLLPPTSFVHESNMLAEEVTEVVPKELDTIIDARFVQALNMLVVSVTFEVLKLFKFNEVRELQSLNILSMLVTFTVSNFVKSTDVRLEHPSNIPDMSSTFVVINESPKVIVLRLWF